VKHGDITQLLHRAESGDAGAQSELMPLVYAELKRVAKSVRGGRNAPLDTTELVHESYLRLVGGAQLSWPDRHRFYSYAAQAMRSILVDRARHEGALKRGGDRQRVEIDAALELPEPRAPSDLVELDAALARLAHIDAQCARVVDLHVFAGLEFADVARCLGIGERSVYRAWQKARALLHGLLAESAAT
jgi:RNA polymerase sigma factor (TIGR02999 family)